ncbi:M20 family metallopeptidase [Neobacillus niacini]|uniref:M20 metallopeptidase family protein n=1 Tax=Neobacillus niacini TaxID=86668 RepID=UPI002860434F|nr:M20 family metallopeptidase [Neobacillus niacini]MDR6998948.1 amidohydrolase [Neobacillus niacini]
MEKVKVCSELFEQLVTIRRQLHQYPELSFAEYNTSAYIRSCLEEWNIPSQQIGETGIIVDIVGEKGEGSHIGVRADIDALPIQEETGLAFSSKNLGVMHACGHDGHTTILLGTVYLLNQYKNQFAGRVRCVFQPGEEDDGAAEQMIQHGVLGNPEVDEMLALHLWPHIPFGTIGVRYGAVTASCDEFKIVIKGKSGHCARPHQGIDAIAISTQVIQALSHLVVKENNPIDPVIIHVGKINGGVATNVVADQVVLEGTTRALTMKTRTRLKERMIQLVQQIVESYGARVEVIYTDGHPPVINADQVTQLVEEAALELYGENAVIRLNEPSMGADDFGSFAERVPSTYFRLGIKKEDEACYDLHHPQFEFDEQIISVGVEVFTWSVLKRLRKEV